MNLFAGCMWGVSKARVRRSVACALALAVAMIAAPLAAGTASATTMVTCTPQAATATTPATLQVAVSGATSSGSPISVSVVSGDYQVGLGGTTVCSGTPDSAASGYPDVNVTSSDVQYLVLDDSNGSLGSSCAQVSTSFTAASDTVAVDGSSTGATFGVTSSSVNLAECTTPDIALGGNVATLAINGASGQANGLDLSNAAGSLGIDMPAATAAGTVTGFNSGPVSTVDFSNVVNVTGPAGGMADFVAQSSAASFTGQGSANMLDLSALVTSSSVPLDINASGGPVNAGGQLLADNQLQVGSTTDSFSDIAEFIGSGSGNTTMFGGVRGVLIRGSAGRKCAGLRGDEHFVAGDDQRAVGNRYGWLGGRRL